jgi:hypothetical protein
MEKTTEMYGNGDTGGIEKLEKELLAHNAGFKDWECSEEMMKKTRGGKALYVQLPARRYFGRFL